jgi:hypothetical protein
MAYQRLIKEMFGMFKPPSSTVHALIRGLERIIHRHDHADKPCEGSRWL